MSITSKAKSLVSKKSILCLRDVWPKRAYCRGNRVHLEAVMEWLSNAHKCCHGKGLSGSYNLDHGWSSGYPETTGYLIPTFYDWSYFANEGGFRDVAKRLADWELEIQLNSGAFPALFAESERPLVFDTGQVIFGLTRAFVEEGEVKYLEAAERAGKWLFETQDSDGAWRKHVLNNIVHTYNTRTAWSLLELFEKNRDDEMLRAAQLNLDWALQQQLANGWFKNNAFAEMEPVTTHTIGYSIRGLLESAAIVGRKEYLMAAKKAADALLLQQRHDGSLPGTFDEEWNGTSGWSCLTGNAQIGLIWFRLFDVTGEQKYLRAAKMISRFLKSVQSLNSLDPGIRGGIKGSHPIYGKYLSYTYPNWAAKFFVDCLLAEERLMVLT